MRIVVSIWLVALVAAAGLQSVRAGPPVCAVYSYHARKVAGKRHARLILAAPRPSADAALSIAARMAQRMVEITDVDFIEVYVHRPEDAVGVLIPGQGDPLDTAVAVVRHNPGDTAAIPGAWQARVHQVKAFGRDVGQATQHVLDRDGMDQRLSYASLNGRWGRDFCGLR